MQFQLPIKINKSAAPIRHTEKLLLIGSCFTEHISARLQYAGWNVLSNPNGILFNPISVVKSLQSYLDRKTYREDNLVQYHEIWHSWDFHSRFSHTDKTQALEQMNTSVGEAADFILTADRLIITLGSSFQYFTTIEPVNYPVANCHRAPGSAFDKRLLSVEEIKNAIEDVLQNIRKINPLVKVIFTISPVRHIRDGVIDNNRSKARLIEAVHYLVEKFDYCDYFPAYELAIDVLRDYRFYDIDMVHPNYAATQYIWEFFSDVYFSEDTLELSKEIESISTAFRHKTRFPDTEAHRKFKRQYKEKIEQLKQQYKHLGLENELKYFSEI